MLNCDRQGASGEVHILKGHGFSHADRELNQRSALAAEGMLAIENTFPSAAKAAPFQKTMNI